ncbi:MAG: hypothetical protein ACLUOF_03830 [Ruminococcus sp.]
MKRTGKRCMAALTATVMLHWHFRRSAFADDTLIRPAAICRIVPARSP